VIQTRDRKIKGYVPFQGRSAGRRRYLRTFSFWRFVVEFVDVVGSCSLQEYDGFLKSIFLISMQVVRR